MKIDLNEIKNNVVPRLNNSVNYLEQAINSIAGYSIPEYFEYKEYMQKLPNNIRSIKNEVNVVKSWAENIANRFQQAERNNSSLINEINSNLNIGNTSASIYSTGAVIGKNTASSNQKGNNILEVIGNNIKKGINKVGTIISSIWNSIFNNISQTTVDLFEACKAKVVANFESLLNMLNFKGENKSDSVTTSKSSNKLIDEPEVQEGLGQLNNLLEIQNNELNVNAENMKNSISSKTYNPYLANLLSKYCNSMDFTDLNDVSFMMNTLRNITEQLDLYIIDGEIPEPEIITETNGTKKVQFAGLIFTYEEWKAIQHYMKSRDLTWYDLKEEFRQSQDLLQTYYQDLLEKKNSIYSLERYIDLYPYTYITTKDDFNKYLERDFKDANPESEFGILTQEEKAIYFYLKEQYSEEEAKEYYNSLKDLINQRKGEIRALEYVSTLDLTGLENIDGISNFLMTTGVGFEDGVWQFGENIVNLIPGQGEIRSELQYKQMYIMQMLTQEINLDEIAQKYGKESGEYKLYEKISKMQSVYKEALGINYNVASSIGNQAIPIAVSFIPEVGTELGVALSALSAAGGAKAQAYQNGVTGWDAYLFAGIQGVTSAVVTKYFAAIPGLSANASTTITGMLKGATQAGVSAVVQSKIDEFTLKVLSKQPGEAVTIDELLKQDANTFITAFSTAFILNGGQALLVKIKGQQVQITPEDLEKCIDEDGNLDISSILPKNLENRENITQRLDIQDVNNTGKVSSTYEALEVTLRKQGMEVNETNMKQLINKINTGDYNCITRSYGAREYIQGLNENIEIINSVDDAIRATLQKQGKEINTSNVNDLINKINNGDYDCITNSYGARNFVKSIFTNKLNLDWLKSRKGLKKAVEYLKNNTNIQNDANEFRSQQYSIFEELKKTGMSDKDAAESAARLFDRVIQDIGWEQVEKYQGIKIKALKGNNFDVNAIKKFIDQLPGNLRKNIKVINISNLMSPYDCYWSVEYDMPYFMTNAIGGDGEITLYDSNKAFSRDSLFETIVHEAGHCFDKNFKMSKSSEWEKAMVDDSMIEGNDIGCTEYATQAKNAKNTNCEDFAEAVNLYINDRGYLENYYPNRYKYLKSILE